MASTELDRHMLRVALDTLREWEYWLTWGHGAELVGLSFKRRDNDWLLILKAVHNERHVVAFCTGQDSMDALKNAAYLCARKELRWKKDKYPRRAS